MSQLGGINSSLVLCILYMYIIFKNKKYKKKITLLNRDCVPLLSLKMLFLDCSSDYWKYEKLLLCFTPTSSASACLGRSLRQF